MAQPPTSPDLIQLAFRLPCDGIVDPAIDVGFAPAGAVDADFELGRECALGDLTVDRGAGQTGPGQDGFEADDPVWLTHGNAASSWLLLTAADPDRARHDGCARAFFGSSQRGVRAAANRCDRRWVHVI